MRKIKLESQNFLYRKLPLCLAILGLFLVALSLSASAPVSAAEGIKKNSFPLNRELEIIPAHAFLNSGYDMILPSEVKYGVVTSPGAPWLNSQTAAISYESLANGTVANTPVRIQIVSDTQEKPRYLALRLIYKIRHYEQFEQSEQFIPLEFPMGTWVSLPVFSGASYPFQCYLTSVNSVGHGRETLLGKAVSIIYGFTPSSQADYVRYGNVPWFDISGSAKKQSPDLVVKTYHDGGYKGAMVSLPIFAWVPFNLNLVYRVALNQASYDNWGGCQVTGNVRETQTQLIEVK